MKVLPLTRKDFWKVPGIGAKTMDTIERILNDHGMRLMTYEEENDLLRAAKSARGPVDES